MDGGFVQWMNEKMDGCEEKERSGQKMAARGVGGRNIER